MGAGWYIDEVLIQCGALQIPSLPSVVNEGELWTFTCVYLITNPLFALDPDAPTGATINPNTGVFTWTPAENKGPGVYPMTIRLTQVGNSLMPVNTGRFTVIVNEVNSTPWLAPISNCFVYPGQIVAFYAVAIDEDLPTNMDRMNRELRNTPKTRKEKPSFCLKMISD